MKRILLITFMLVSALVTVSWAQTRSVTGTVTSAEDGSTLPGVNVILQGTTTGTVTDIDGNYRLNVPEEGGTLTFTFIGLATQQIQIGARSVVDVIMQSDVEQLGEVVVIGYGEVDKRKLTSAISSIEGSDIASQPIPSFDQGLAGRATGVQVTVPSGVLGETPQIRIRGVNSITSGAQPLIVVDGVPMIDGNNSAVAPNNALADINPSDIASFEILKDGAATAIYGSRAANGVILITTKSGKSGKTQVNYDFYTGINKVSNRFDVLNAEEFIRISNEKFATVGIAPQAFPGPNNVDTDWQDVIYQDGFVQSHSLSLTGGNESSKYYISAGYMDQEGAVVNNSMERVSILGKVDYTGQKWLDLGVKLGVTRQVNNGLNTGENSLSGNVYNATKSFPNAPVYNIDHPTGYNLTDDNVAQGRGNNLQNIANNITNLQYSLDNNKQEAVNYRVLGNAYAQINLLEDIKLRTQLGVDVADNQDFMSWNAVHGDGRGSGGYIYRGAYQVFRWNWQNTISYNKTLAEKHTFGVVIGAEFQKTTEDFFSGEGQGFSDDFFLKNGLISGSYDTQYSGGGVVETGFDSYFGRLMYDYENRYLMSFSVRNDAISSLPKANRKGTFLGGSIGWNIARESFFEGIGVISDLKVRASYAETGNVNIPAFPYLGIYGPELYGSETAIRFERVGNPELKWETSSKYALGLDFSILSNRISGSIDWYKNDITDLILEAPTPPSLGIPSNVISQNVGTMFNQGLEFSLNTLNVDRQDFQWTSSFNISTNKNEITSLYKDSDIIFARKIHKVGESVGAFFGYQYEGVNPANGNPLYRKADGSIVQGNPVNQQYYAYDPNNPSDVSESAEAINLNDKVVLGQALPKYFGGFGNTFTYKGLSLDVFLSFSGGNKVLNVTKQEALGMDFGNNHKDILNRWTLDNTDTDVPRLYNQAQNFLNTNGSASSRFLEDGDFLRVQNITLSYNFTSDALGSIGLDVIRNLRIYAQVQNAFVFTNYTGIDPELNFSTSTDSNVAINSSSGIDWNTNPTLRTFTVGLNIGL